MVNAYGQDVHVKKGTPATIARLPAISVVENAVGLDLMTVPCADLEQHWFPILVYVNLD